MSDFADPNFFDFEQQYDPMRPPLAIPTSDPLNGALSSLCFNSEWEPYIRGAIKILTREEIWDSDDPVNAQLAVERVHTLLAQVDHGCGGAGSVFGSFMGGSGQPACGPTLVTDFNFGCTSVYDAVLDQITGCQASGNGHLTFHCHLDLTGFPGFQVTRIQGAWRTNTTLAPASGLSPDDNYIRIGSNLAYHGISDTYLGVDDFTLDTGGIAFSGPYIEFHGEVRCTAYPGGGAYNNLVAVAVEGTGDNPWEC
jgi:hypothetical protein